MYCDKCGAENAPDAAFCRKCGREITEIDVETRVAVRPSAVPSVGSPLDRLPDVSQAYAGRVEDLSDDAHGPVIFSISPTLMFVKAGYVAAAIGALLLAAICGALFSNAWIGVVIGLCLFLIPAYFHLVKRLVRYTLTDAKIEIDSGLVARTTRNIPLRRIQDVTVSANVIQRLLGFGDVVIDNSSEVGGRIVLDNINRPQEIADKLLRQMRRIES